MSLPTLYQLEEDWDGLMELAESEPDMDLADTIEGMTGTLEEKRKAVGYYLENLKATVKARREAAQRMTESARIMENRHERLTRYLIDSMRKHEIKSIECPEWTLRLQRNPVKVIIENESDLPFSDNQGNELVNEVTTYKPDKKAIREAVERGEDVPGVRLERGWRLVLK